ncbi:MAG: ribose-phosphate pyrophosphokinase [Candidatus Sumerlaeia bacterium]|nr:ribose-phosphate pyrophosphokinase [Candidatus Sumerlaeia bacterium]
MTQFVSPPLIIAGTSSMVLGEAVANHLEIRAGKLEVRRFADGELFVKIMDNVRGRDVYLIQSTNNPANEKIMEMLLTLDALKRASAARINLVIPYFGYARQDRKDQGRVALSAKLVANLITVAGADRVLAVDLHAGQLQGFFDIPVDHLVSGPILLHHVKTKMAGKEICVVSPDVGNVKLARDYATKLDAPLAIIDKHRPKANVAEVKSIIGLPNIVGKNVLIFDDMIDTAGTICNAAVALKSEGAEDIYALATHGVLSGPALERLAAAPIKEVIITDTIYHEPGKLLDKITVLSVAQLLGKAIDRIHRNSSVSALFRDIY